MAGLLVVRSRKVRAERQKGQVQGGNPNWGEGGTREKPWLHQMPVPVSSALTKHFQPRVEKGLLHGH